MVNANGQPSIYDQDGELHRKEILKKTKELAGKMKEIEMWYFTMGFNQFRMKEGKELSLISADFKWGDEFNEEVRSELTSTIRLTWRPRVWREMVKLQFHNTRRI